MKSLQIFLILFSAIFISYTSCRTASYTKNTNKQSQNDSLIIDPQIKNIINFWVKEPEDALDEELFEMYQSNPKMKKSSTVKIFIINDKLNSIRAVDRLAGRAFIKNDTLIIRNGVSGTDSGYGVDTKIINNKIFTNYIHTLLLYLSIYIHQNLKLKNKKSL